MKYFSIFLFQILFILFIALVSDAQEDQVISNQGEITISAKSGNVWKVLTNTKKYAKAVGYKWKSGKKNVDTVGDRALMEFLEQQTAYEVTFIEPRQRLSVKVIPSDARYVNEKTWVVTPIDKWSTRVSVTDVYTIPPGEVPPTVNEQIDTLQKRLERLRSIAERS